MGEDPFRVERLWQKMYARTHQHGRRGAVLMGLSGIDIALWDIIGQATRTPLYRRRTLDDYVTKARERP